MTRVDTQTEKIFNSLTEKQTAVLDLLLDHLTSKQIARRLNISHHTVDQRINLAKQKFGLTTRNELATAYRTAKSIYERTVYQTPDVETSAIPLHMNEQDETADYALLTHPKPSQSRAVVDDEADYRVVPEMFEGRYGKAFRIAATLIVSLILLIFGLAGLTMFSEISEMLSR